MGIMSFKEATRNARDHKYLLSMFKNKSGRIEEEVIL
jgi:hypothetical protein